MYKSSLLNCFLVHRGNGCEPATPLGFGLGQAEGCDSTTPGAIPQGNIAAVEFGHLANDAQAQTRTLLARIGSTQGVKPLKNTRHCIVGHARPGIGYRYLAVIDGDGNAALGR